MSQHLLTADYIVKTDLSRLVFHTMTNRTAKFATEDAEEDDTCAISRALSGRHSVSATYASAKCS
jgi:hypothetical protein